MQLLENRPSCCESQDDGEVAYQVASQLLKAHPDLAGVVGTSSFDARRRARDRRGRPRRRGVRERHGQSSAANKDILEKGIVQVTDGLGSRGRRIRNGVSRHADPRRRGHRRRRRPRRQGLRRHAVRRGQRQDPRGERLDRDRRQRRRLLVLIRLGAAGRRPPRHSTSERIHVGTHHQPRGISKSFAGVQALEAARSRSRPVRCTASPARTAAASRRSSRCSRACTRPTAAAIRADAFVQLHLLVIRGYAAFPKHRDAGGW